MTERRIVREQPASIRLTRHDKAQPLQYGGGHRRFGFGQGNQQFRFGHGHQQFRFGHGGAIFRFGAGHQYFSK
jgi:hypothetical protein